VAEAGGWRVDRHPCLLGDVTGGGRAGIVWFSNAGVPVGANNGDGTFNSRHCSSSRASAMQILARSSNRDRSCQIQISA
jgi:hypothetical protein